MLTYVTMFLLVAFLAFLVLYRDENGKGTTFFDIESTNCMRGFWCIIVLLVHIPEVYQNPIQDALGSFAYIAVTFFFMTSGYGLTLGVQKRPDSIREGFWKRRVGKLLLPLVLVNVLRLLAEWVTSGEFDLLNLLHVNAFVRQILAFYLLFWLVFRFLGCLPFGGKAGLLCGVVAVFSIAVYLVGDNPLFAWPVETFGFMYGILLALYKDKLCAFARHRWLLKSGAVCVAALALGVAYLKFKAVPLAGDYVCKLLLGAAILLLVLFLNSKLPLGNSVSRFLGGISYEVYLAHDVVFIALSAVPVVFDSGVYVVLSVALTVLLSYLVHLGSGGLLRLFSKK